MNGTDRASRYSYQQYHQHPYHHHHHHQYQQPHHPLPSLAAAAAGSFPFSCDADSQPTSGRAVDPAAGTGSRVFATPPLSMAECCYSFDEGVRRYAANGVMPTSVPVTATTAAYLGFRHSSETCRPSIEARFASAPIPEPEMTSQTASPADCGGGGGLLSDVKSTRATPSGDTKENGFQPSTGGVSSPVTSSVRGCLDDVYAMKSKDVQRHHKRLSTDVSTDDVIKNVNKIDRPASPSRDYSRHGDRKKTSEGDETKHEVSKLHCMVRLFEYSVITS